MRFSYQMFRIIFRMWIYNKECYDIAAIGIQVLLFFGLNNLNLFDTGCLMPSHMTLKAILASTAVFSFDFYQNSCFWH